LYTEDRNHPPLGVSFREWGYYIDSLEEEEYKKRMLQVVDIEEFLNGKERK
jgi:hypothetical protein